MNNLFDDESLKEFAYLSLLETVSQKVLTRLSEKGVDDLWLADQLGISQILLNDRMNGVAPFDLRFLAAVSKVLGMTAHVEFK
jgi:hypothetical protein